MLAPRALLESQNKLLKSMRCFFETHGFLEAHSPLLVINPGLEPHLKYFQTEFVPEMGGRSTPRRTLYLPTSPEYSLKKILAKLEPPARLYELARAFRNGEISKQHQPEFSMLEFYGSLYTLKELSDTCFELLHILATSVEADPSWSERQDFDLEDLFVQQAGINFNELRRQPGDFSDNFHLTYFNKIDPWLRDQRGQVYVWNYPIEEAMLAKPCAKDPSKAHRFEVYFNGTELGNAFDELLDRGELEQRCRHHSEERRRLHGACPDMDSRFLEACAKLSHVPCAGIALGWDRIVMKLLNLSNLNEVLLLPHEA